MSVKSGMTAKSVWWSEKKINANYAYYSIKIIHLNAVAQKIVTPGEQNLPSVPKVFQHWNIIWHYEYLRRHLDIILEYKQGIICYLIIFRIREYNYITQVHYKIKEILRYQKLLLYIKSYLEIKLNEIINH